MNKRVLLSMVCLLTVSFSYELLFSMEDPEEPTQGAVENGGREEGRQEIPKESQDVPKKERRRSRAGFRRRVYDDYDDYPYGFGRSRRYGKNMESLVSEIMTEALMEHVMDPDGVDLAGKIEKDLVGGLIEGAQWSIAGGLMSGFIGSVNKQSKSLSDELLTTVVNWLKGGWRKIVRQLKNGRPVTSHDVSRWRKSINNMLKGLAEIAEKAKTSASIGQNMNLLVSGDFQRHAEEEDAEEPVQGAVDENWRENAQLFLNRIIQIVREVELRIQYYGADDEIIICLSELRNALIGVREQDEAGDFMLGGIYARIASAHSLADLANSQTDIALKLFHKHIEGLLVELESWIREKTGKSVSSGSRLSNSSYGGYGANSGSLDY